MRAAAATAAVVLGAALGLLLASAPAAAAPDKADALFSKGKQLLAKKKYAEACPTFEKVDALDPGIGAKLNVARCYQEWGKLARAYRWYADAEKMAKEGRDDRAAKIHGLMETLDGDVPRLTIRATEGADLAAAAISLDGEKLAADALGTEARVDPGPHEITYVVNGETKTKTVALERGGAGEVTLELPKAAGGGGGKTDPKAGDGGDKGAKPSAPGRGRRIAAFALLGAGAASLGVSAYLALDARGTYRDALSAHCMNKADGCDDEGLRITHDARGRANLATVLGVAGAAVAAGGLVLYLTAPRSSGAEDLSRNTALYVAPQVGPGAGMLVLGGRY